MPHSKILTAKSSMHHLTLKDGTIVPITIRSATTNDINAISALNIKWQRASVADINDGYIGAAFTIETISQLIALKQISIASHNETVAGYYLANNISKDGVIGRHEEMIASLIQQQIIPTDYNIVTGAQVVVDTPYMGSGIRRLMLEHLANTLSFHYDYLFGTIAKDNHRACVAHPRDGWQIIGEEDELLYILYPFR